MFHQNIVMVAAFVVMGIAIAVDGLKKPRASLIPFALFGLAMAAVGLFPHKPIDPTIAFNESYHKLHGILASIAGIAVTAGFVWQAVLRKGKDRVVCAYLALVALLFPLLMLGNPDFRGIIQRVMYLQILGWIWIFYPKSFVTVQNNFK